MKRDPYNHKQKYFNWKEENTPLIKGLNKANSEIILKYLKDMENGINISNLSVKGSRSYPRLNNLITRMLFFARRFKKGYNLDDITKITEEQLLSFFSDMKSGVIKKGDGQNYKSIETYAKIFKAFWHWHQKVNKKNGNGLPDITEDLDTRADKPKWVYLNEEQVKIMCNNAKYEYKVLFMFLLDTGIRSPTELVNVKVSDLYNDCKELNIRDEISKTFGRRIKLMLCPSLLNEYIKVKGLKNTDYLFDIQPYNANKYIKRIAVKLFGNGETEAGGKYSEMSLYDLRHISCCYWLPRYKSESALKYRFGWKKSDKIHYYSELLGMKDTIAEEDLLIDVTKTEMEKRLIKTEQENVILKEKMSNIEEDMKRMLELVNNASSKV